MLYVKQCQMTSESQILISFNKKSNNIKIIDEPKRGKEKGDEKRRIKFNWPQTVDIMETLTT